MPAAKTPSFILMALLALSPCMAKAESNPSYVLILSKEDHALHVLDHATLRHIASVATGEDSHEIVLSEDQTTAYVSNPLMSASGHAIHVINLRTMSLEKTIDTTPFFVPHGLAYIQGQLWFTAQGAKAVAVYNPAQGRITQALGTGQDFTHLIHVTPEGTRFYTTNAESGTVSIFEKKEIPPYMPPTGILPAEAKPRLEWRQTLVDVGAGAEGFDVSKNGKELWTARPDGHIIVVDLAKKAITHDIPTGIEGLHRLKFTPDGDAAAVVSVKTGDLLFYSVRTQQLEKRIPVCQGAGIYMDEAGGRMFISCTPNNSVAVVDLGTREVVKRLSIGRPDGITVATPSGP